MTYATTLSELWQSHQAPKPAGAPTVVSLFAGCGGSSLGYSAAGFRELLAAEWDRTACKVFAANFPAVPLYAGDVAQLDPAALDLEPGALTLLDSSCPCQPFSTTGLRRTADPRAQLWREMIRLTAAWQPQYVLFENVAGLVRGKMRAVFSDICGGLRGAGYSVEARLIDCSRLGVPQRRQRVLILASRIAPGSAQTRRGTLPSPTGRVVSVRDAWEDLSDPGEFLVPTGKGARLAPLVAPGSQGSKALKERGGREVHFSAKRLAWDQPSMTLVREVRASTCSGFLHPREHRFLGVNELARIQSFPDQFSWLDLGYVARHNMIGNSVPPLVTRAIGRSLASAITSAALRSLSVAVPMIPARLGKIAEIGRPAARQAKKSPFCSATWWHSVATAGVFGFSGWSDSLAA